MSNQFPMELLEAVKYLSGLVNIENSHKEGRVNSAKDEDTVISLLKEKYGDNIQEPTSKRPYYDVRIFGYPVQIKSCSFKSNAACNLSSKCAMLYVFTNLSEKEVESYHAKSWESFEKALINNKVKTSRDYYILVVNKDDSKVHLMSLKSLKKLNHNGNNLPFQMAIGENIQSVYRSYDEAYQFIIGVYKNSVKAKLSAHPYVDSL